MAAASSPGSSNRPLGEPSGWPRPFEWVRAALGGVLMGLANLVPGISGGTMLLAVGIYPQFIAAIADLSLLKIRPRPVAIFVAVAGAAGCAILLLAGPVKGLVVDHRWMMYSLFIGLTLGGVPLVWKLARPINGAVVRGMLLGLLIMIGMTFGFDPEVRAGGNLILLFLSGLAGASAMILPGISGGYLLLILGQYETILKAVDKVKLALLGGESVDRVALFLEALWVVVPVGLGVLLGVVAVSNLLKWLLSSFRKATLGALLGLLFGAVIGLYPFQEGISPKVGDRVKGVVQTEATLLALDPEDWPLARFRPEGGQIAISVALILLGFGLTQGISLIDPKRGEADALAQGE